jgi:hypothetical protein
LKTYYDWKTQRDAKRKANFFLQQKRTKQYPIPFHPQFINISQEQWNNKINRSKVKKMLILKCNINIAPYQIPLRDSLLSSWKEIHKITRICRGWSNLRCIMEVSMWKENKLVIRWTSSKHSRALTVSIILIALSWIWSKWKSMNRFYSKSWLTLLLRTNSRYHFKSISKLSSKPLS